MKEPDESPALCFWSRPSLRHAVRLAGLSGGYEQEGRAWPSISSQHNPLPDVLHRTNRHQHHVCDHSKNCLDDCKANMDQAVA